MAQNDTLPQIGAVKGLKGYMRLVQLVARLFYSCEIPPPEEQDEVAHAKAQKRHSYEGLGILLLDFLTSDKVDGFVDETAIAQSLRLSPKFIRKALRYLEGEHLLVSESVKFAFNRTNGEEPDDAEIEVRKRHETHVFWAVDYPRVLDIIRLRVHGIRELLKRNSGNSDLVVTYSCPSCGGTYTSLQAATLIDPVDGVFRCEDCSSVLEEKIGDSVAGLQQASAASRKERQGFFKELTHRFESQIQPVMKQIAALDGVDPPDPGSLKDWYQHQKNTAIKRAQRLEEARRKFKASGAAGAYEMTEEQLLEWADRAELVIDLAGDKASDGMEEEEKELPAWFRQDASVASDSAAQGAAQSHEDAALTADDVSRKRQLEFEYLQQYLRQIKAVEDGEDKKEDVKDEEKKDATLVTETQNGVPPGVVHSFETEEQDAKRIKLEPKVDGIKQEPEEPQKEDEADLDWEDV
eukprot:jgi/Picsp_1/732/NSC_04221-R1_general transcription factor iie subunit 1-like